MPGAWWQEQGFSLAFEQHSQPLDVPGALLGTDCIDSVSPLITLGGECCYYAQISQIRKLRMARMQACTQASRVSKAPTDD